MKIDFVSDVACPWCAVGLNSLEQALAEIGPAIPVELHFQPFELNPTMAPDGADAAAYLKNKYGMGDAQLAQNRAVLKERGAAVGFTFGERRWVWNTFDAHRLLHWAGTVDAAGPADPAAGADAAGPAGTAAPQPGLQRRLKHALLQAYHGEGRNPGARDVLLALCGAVGLDVRTAAEVLDSGRYADEVRAAERGWQDAGIQAVPSLVVDGRHLIQGGQSPEAYLRALRQIAAEAPAAA